MRSFAIALTLWLLVSGAGCGGEDRGAVPPAETARPAAPQPPPAEPAPAAPAVPAAAGPGPVYACLPGDPKAGESHYDLYCASCHGTGGDGQGPAAAGLNPKPAKHTDGAYMNALGNDHMFRVIDEGGAAASRRP